MNKAVYQARMELFKTMNLPVSQASVHRFRRRSSAGEHISSPASKFFREFMSQLKNREGGKG